MTLTKLTGCVTLLCLISLILKADDTIKIEKGIPHLFVDDVLIESSEGLVRTLHEPVKDYPSDSRFREERHDDIRWKTGLGSDRLQKRNRCFCRVKRRGR